MICANGFQKKICTLCFSQGVRSERQNKIISWKNEFEAVCKQDVCRNSLLHIKLVLANEYIKSKCL